MTKKTANIKLSGVFLHKSESICPSKQVLPVEQVQKANK